MNLQRLDPRLKLFLLISLSTTALILRTPAALSVLLLIAIIILLAGGVFPKIIWLKLRGLFGLLVMLFIMQCLFNRRGDPLLALAGLTIVTEAGFQVSVLICLRLLIIILSGLVVFMGETRDYLLAMTQLKVPYEIAFMTLAALRFLPMLREEAQDVLCAAQMRGLRIKKTGLRKQAGAYVSIVIPVVAGAIRRADQLSIAMEARGFRAMPHRTSMRRLRMRIADWIYAAGFCMLLAAVIIFAFYL